METLASEIAKILGITVEKAVELYPVIRGQMVWYNIISSFSIPLTIFFIICVITTGVFGTMIYGEYVNMVPVGTRRYDEAEHQESMRLIKILTKKIIILWIVVSLFWTLINIARPALAPDVTMIMQFL